MNRRGAVLVITLAALLLLGAVIATALLAALEEVRAGRNAEAALTARAAAEAAVARTVAEGDAVAGALPAGGVALIGGTLRGATFEARLVRGAGDFLQLRGVGRDGRLGLRREVITTLRLVPLVPGVRAVFLTRSAVAPALMARIDPVDQAPPGWVCGPLGPSAPGITVPGAPDSSFFGLGLVRWPALTAWLGRPRAADSLAARAHAGDLVLDGQRFTGLLVVDGVLTLRGGAELVGTVVARGGVVFGPGGGTVFGAVVAESLGMVSGVTPAFARLGYSACAVEGSGRPPAPLRGLPGLSPAEVWY